MLAVQSVSLKRHQVHSSCESRDRPRSGAHRDFIPADLLPKLLLSKKRADFGLSTSGTKSLTSDLNNSVLFSEFPEYGSPTLTSDSKVFLFNKCMCFK